MEKIKIICVVGATASGKTGLGVELARALDGEIISADSMQVYQGMPIATAAATPDEQCGVPHHLLQCIPPQQAFSVAEFVGRAGELITDIVSRGHVPIVVGGTGLFVDSLVRGISFCDVGGDDCLRNELDQLSTDELYNRLQQQDPVAAADIHPNNRKRVIRALELCASGTSKTEQNSKSMLTPSPYDALYIGIGYHDRQTLYDRINMRVDGMVSAGLVDEAADMRRSVTSTACQAIGHKELYPYFDGDITLDQALDNLKRKTRNYAKRQLTWFRRNDDIHWLYADDMSGDALVSTAIQMASDHLLR